VAAAARAVAAALVCTFLSPLPAEAVTVAWNLTSSPDQREALSEEELARGLNSVAYTFELFHSGADNDVVRLGIRAVNDTATLGSDFYFGNHQPSVAAITATARGNETKTFDLFIVEETETECDEFFHVVVESAVVHYRGDPNDQADLLSGIKNKRTTLFIRDNDGYDDGGDESNVFSIPFKKNACGGNGPVHHGVNLRPSNDYYGGWHVESAMEGNYMTIGDMVTNERIAPRVGGRYDPKANKVDVVRGWRRIPATAEAEFRSLWRYGQNVAGGTPRFRADDGNEVLDSHEMVLGFTTNKGSGQEFDPRRQWCDRLDLAQAPRVLSVGKAVVRGTGYEILIRLYDVEVSNWVWMKSGEAGSTADDMARAFPCNGPKPNQGVCSGTVEASHLGGKDWLLETETFHFDTTPHDANYLFFAHRPSCTWRFVSRAAATGKTPGVEDNAIRIDLKNIGNEWVYECL